MGFFTERIDLLHMVMVDVGVDTKHSTEDVLDVQLEFLGERDVDGGGKDLLIIELVLDPAHQTVNVLGSGDLEGLLHLDSIGPMILVLGSRAHNRARLFGAKL